jgi:hypothetical protein
MLDKATRKHAGARILMSNKKRSAGISAVRSDSLAASAWMRIVSRYLTVSIRAGAYAASMHLLSILDSSASALTSSIVIRELLYLLYGIIAYEVAAYIVRIRYTPTFARAGDGVTARSPRLVLNDSDYDYRVAAETLIYESLLYYGFTVLVALVLCNTVAVQAGWQNLGLGLLGGLVSYFNFFGVVIIASSGASFSLKAIPAYLGGCVFITPLIAYLAFTIGYAFFR